MPARSSFSLSVPTFHRLLWRRAPVIVPILVALAWLAASDGASTLDKVLGTAGAAFLYLFGRGYSWVAVGAEGLRGPYRPVGPRVGLRWSEPLVVRPARSMGLPGVDVAARDGTRTLFIPREILQSAHFQDAVAAFAPREHMLRRVHGEVGPLGRSVPPGQAP